MIEKVSEDTIVKRFHEHITKLKFEEVSIYLEVPSLGQSVDMVYAYNNELTFVEAKLNDWKKALQQCRNHTLVADFIYILIATKKINKELLDTATSFGIGVLHYRDGNFFEVLEAKKNSQAWEPQRNELKNYLINKACLHHLHNIG